MRAANSEPRYTVLRSGPPNATLARLPSVRLRPASMSARHEAVLGVVALGARHRLGIRVLEDHRLAAVRRDAQQTVADHARDPDAALGVELEAVREGARAELGDRLARAELAARRESQSG